MTAHTISASKTTTATEDHGFGSELVATPPNPTFASGDTLMVTTSGSLTTEGSRAHGIRSVGAGTTTAVAGTVSARGYESSGVFLAGAAGTLNTVTVQSGGSVAGALYGLDLRGDNEVSNAGSIKGGSSTAAINLAGSSSGDLRITNEAAGFISGTINNASGSSADPNATISVDNKGSITGSITTTYGSIEVTNTSGISGSVNSTSGSVKISNTTAASYIGSSISARGGLSSIANVGIIYGAITGTDSVDSEVATTFSITNSGKILGTITLGKFDDLYDGRLGTVSGAITLGAGNDRAYGGAGAETIDGGAGDDTLDGGDGNDRLNAGIGANLIDGGAGNDTVTKSLVSTGDIINGGDGVDTLTYSGTAGGATVNLSITTAQVTGYGTDTINGMENVTGTASADILTGNAAANALTGNAGADQLRGEAGNDTLNGGNDGDTLWGGAGNDSIDGGTGLDSLFGDDGSDTLNGGADADSMWGGLSHDQLDGGAGTDRLFGEDGNDTLLGGADADTLSGGDGNDGMRGDAGNDQLSGDAGNDTLLGGNDVDLLSGGLGDDYLGGENGNDTLIGDDGRDTLSGGADADILRAGASNDSLDGGAGNDFLYGDSGHDTIFGGTENDFLNGGNGKDYLSGGLGKDIFAFTFKPSARANIDTVADFNVKDDTIYLDNAVFKALGRKGTATKPAPLSKKMFSIGQTIDSKDDHIIYDKKGGVVYYDADGTGASTAVPIAFVGKNLKLTYHDFFVI